MPCLRHHCLCLLTIASSFVACETVKDAPAGDDVALADETSMFSAGPAGARPIDQEKTLDGFSIRAAHPSCKHAGQSSNTLVPRDTPVPSEQPLRGSATTQIGIVQSLNPLVLEVAGKDLKAYLSKAPPKGLRYGSEVEVTFGTIPTHIANELGLRTMGGITKIRPAKARFSSLLLSYAPAKGTKLHILHDGSAYVDDALIGVLEDRIVTKIMKIIADAAIDEIKDEVGPTVYGWQEQFILSCARRQAIAISNPKLAPIHEVLQIVIANLGKLNVHRLQFEERVEMQIVDWPKELGPLEQHLKGKPLAIVKLDLPSALEAALPWDSITSAQGTSNVFVKDQGKTYLIEKRRGYYDTYGGSIMIEECLPSGFRCKTLPSGLTMDGVGQAGLEIPSEVVSALHLMPPTYMGSASRGTPLVDGKYVYNTVTIYEGRALASGRVLSVGRIDDLLQLPPGSPTVSELFSSKRPETEVPLEVAIAIHQQSEAPRHPMVCDDLRCLTLTWRCNSGPRCQTGTWAGIATSLENYVNKLSPDTFDLSSLEAGKEIHVDYEAFKKHQRFFELVEHRKGHSYWQGKKVYRSISVKPE